MKKWHCPFFLRKKQCPHAACKFEHAFTTEKKHSPRNVMWSAADAFRAEQAEQNTKASRPKTEELVAQHTKASRPIPEVQKAQHTKAARPEPDFVEQAIIFNLLAEISKLQHLGKDFNLLCPELVYTTAKDYGMDGSSLINLFQQDEKIETWEQLGFVKQKLLNKVSTF